MMMSGQLSASWNTNTNSNFQVQSIEVPSATVQNVNGLSVGSGPVALSSATPGAVSITGLAHLSVNGLGALSVYGFAETSIGVSGDWQNYTATITGDVSITLTALDGSLTLNGQALPAGTYTITTGSATLSGSGTMSRQTSPERPRSLRPTARSTSGRGAAISPSAASRSMPTNETTLDGYTGTITVAANGDGTDLVSLNGNAGNVLQVTTTSATLTTDQNTPVTFTANVKTSLADTYTLTANAPPAGRSPSMTTATSLRPPRLASRAALIPSRSSRNRAAIRTSCPNHCRRHHHTDAAGHDVRRQSRPHIHRAV